MMKFDPPKYLSPIEKKTWRQLATTSPVQLKDSDKSAFEMMVRIVTRMNSGAELTSNERLVVIKLFENFGMTPSSRVKSPAPAQAESPSKFAKFKLVS